MPLAGTIRQEDFEYVAFQGSHEWHMFLRDKVTRGKAVVSQTSQRHKDDVIDTGRQLLQIWNCQEYQPVRLILCKRIAIDNRKSCVPIHSNRKRQVLVVTFLSY